MDSSDTLHCSLQRAQQLIRSHAGVLPAETVGLQKAQRRIVANDILAILPQPSFDESTRDGYVVSEPIGQTDKENRYQIIDEIPAGKPYLDNLMFGAACKIMTGGCVPRGGRWVVPFEKCSEENGIVIVDDRFLQSAKPYIRKKGSTIAEGDRLVATGVLLEAGHLALLSSCGIESVEVVTKPRVGYACTGSELSLSGDGLGPGQKVSSNAFLLEGQIAAVGAQPVNMGIIKDTELELLELFKKVRGCELDVMVSTGGMGPGKYDLVERLFEQAGGKILFHSIEMRPGKALLFGLLGATLFFGLPGPPPAVRTLLNLLVGPALLMMLGQRGIWPKTVEAHLLSQLTVKRNDVLRFQDAILEFQAGECSVRLANHLEIPNCFILLPQGKTSYCEGERVTVYLESELAVRVE